VGLKVPDAAREPLERLEEESAAAYRAFDAYRRLGPTRSIRKVSKRLYPPRDPTKGRSRDELGRVRVW
jgi:hypothetical protein